MNYSLGLYITSFIIIDANFISIAVAAAEFQLHAEG